MATTTLFSFSAIPVEVTYDSPSLSVGLLVKRWNGTAWVQEGLISAAALVTSNNTYGAIYTPLTTAPYILELMAYTDDTFTVPLDGYLPSSRSVRVDPSLLSLIESSLSADLVGHVSIEPMLSGVVLPEPSLVGNVSVEESLSGSLGTDSVEPGLIQPQIDLIGNVEE